MMEVDFNELQQITETLLTHLRSSNLDSVELGVDFYWNMPKAAKYDPYYEPTSLTVGQLSDDWAELQRILSGEREPLAHHLVWLAAILRAVGEKVVFSRN